MSEKNLEKAQENTEKKINESEIENSEIAESVSAETADAVKKVVVEAIKGEFSGPIPPPSIIKGYEDVVPGAADRIIRMAEEQAKHRQEMERKMVESESRDGLLGILFAFMLGIGCIVAAIIMVICVPQSAGAICGAILGVTGIGSIVSSFIRSAKGSNAH